MPKKSTAKKSNNKSDFIRSLAAATPAGEVVKQAKAAGITLTPGLVYAVRAAAKRKRSKGSSVGSVGSVGKASGRGAGKKAAKTVGLRSAAGAAEHDMHFVALVLDLGLAKAEALLERVRAKVREL